MRRGEEERRRGEEEKRRGDEEWRGEIKLRDKILYEVGRTKMEQRKGEGKISKGVRK